MSPPFIPPKGGKDKKQQLVPAVYIVGDGCVAISGRTVWKEAMSSYPTCFFSFFHT